MSVVAVDNLWKYYGDFPALRDITMRTEAGACLALIGRNGAGKTTLLRLIAGFGRPAKGTITVAGYEPRAAEARRQMGYLGHGISVYDELTATENLMLYGKLYGVANAPAAAREWLVRVGLERVQDGLVREFSRGMRQRLAVARAFLHRPSVLLLDEPFTSLDDQAIAMLQSLLREALDEGRTVMMSTHQLREALELATHTALLEGGKLSYYGPRSAEMVADPGYLYATYGRAGRQTSNRGLAD